MTSSYTPPNLVTPTSGGNAGDGSLNGALTVQANSSLGTFHTSLMKGGSAGHVYFLTADTFGNLAIQAGAGGGLSIYSGLSMSQTLTYYNNVAVQGLGVSPLYGLDNRTGLTATDSSAKTLYTTTAASQVYRVTARVFGKSGTISSAVYTIGWTEGGTSMTETVSISAVSTMDSAVFLIQPDDGKAITVQLTTLSGTSPVVDVAAALEEMA